MECQSCYGILNGQEDKVLAQDLTGSHLSNRESLCHQGLMARHVKLMGPAFPLLLPAAEQIGCAIQPAQQRARDANVNNRVCPLAHTFTLTDRKSYQRCCGRELWKHL